ncbi:MAG: putative efflux transporter permease [Bacillales bacterium]|jgi:ABC-2 type transport system permease protein|nr:putative efflux transporter permease [Bacillales bacterium]
MIRLVQNEWKKIFQTRAKWLFYGLILGTVGLALTFSSYTMDDNQSHNFVEFMYNVSFFKISITIFTVSIGATIFSNEFSSGTIKYLLIRPVNRLKIFVSKVAAVLIVGFSLMIGILVLSFLVGCLFYGFEEIGTSQKMAFEVLISYLSEAATFIAMSCFAMMLSIFFRNSSFALGVSIVILFAGSMLTQVLKILQENWARFLLFSNVDFTQYIGHNSPLFKGMSVPFSIGIILFHIISFTFIGLYFFKNRDVLS